VVVDIKQTSVTVEQVSIHLLQPHPRNVEIYGDEDVTELSQSIAESGWIKPLTVTPLYVVISGHRRYRAALALGYTELPVVIEVFASPEAEMERLLRENENRGKKPEQQIREGMTWEPIEKERAEKREKLGNTRYPGKNSSQGCSEGRVIDIVARRVGLGSGDTYKKGREVVEYMDSMFSIGSERGPIIRMNLNDESINAAHKAMKKYQQLDKEAEEKARREEEEKQRQQELARQRYLEAVQKAEHCTLYHCGVTDLSHYVEPESVDCIITDPPYPKEFLPVYTDLARFAAYALKPGGSLVVMVGQSYLQEILQRLSSTGLTYQWTCAYLTPGIATQVHHAHAQSFWKPLLWFTKGEYTGMYVYDVFQSDKSDKLKHEWGQSESGIASIMKRMTRMDELVCDPFVGGGTTAIVAMEMKRRFVGCDIDETCVVSLEERKASLVHDVMVPAMECTS
jgi:predicted DNA binding CopG/RHH family protein